MGFLLAGFPIGVGAFVAGITMFSFGVGLLVTLLGVPVLVGALTAARGLARVERRRVEAVTGRSLPPHHYREPGGTGLAGLLNRLREPQAWRDLLHTVVAFPVRMLGFALALAWTVGGVGEVLYVLWSWAIPRDDDEQGLLDLAFDISSRSADIGFHTGIGVVLLATAVPVVRALVAMQTALARGLLTNQHAAVRAHRGR
ncbi:hypothetical protein DVA86_28580 [Streptomyces armeniacus]|uniref:Putative sensor domain-containing protein n=1 Tax=Streptomyces armeniacus TaxID=83291 RepID=A0A345XWF7_9ACTN|nr:sensor domain-containing protein [Streptomyces armeniacus]AXK35973.1 hypothetical protein DVA86_28580 [Streptomyces armeniacus]